MHESYFAIIKQRMTLGTSMPFFLVLCRMLFIVHKIFADSWKNKKPYMMPAAFNSRFFCRTANLRASSSWRSHAFYLAFFPWVFASLA
jgi:hypothetical protein